MYEPAGAGFRHRPDGWPAGIDLALLLIAVAAAIFFVRHELNEPSPIMPPKLMMQREIGPSMLGSLLLGVAFLSLDTYVPLYVQAVRGGGARAAASVVTPVMLTWALSGIAAAPMVIRFGFRRIAVFGASLVVIGFSGLLLGAIYNWPQWALTCILALTGFGFGPTSMSYLLAAQDAVQWQQRGVITGNVQFFSHHRRGRRHRSFGRDVQHPGARRYGKSQISGPHTRGTAQSRITCRHILCYHGVRPACHCRRVDLGFCRHAGWSNRGTPGQLDDVW